MSARFTRTCWCPQTPEMTGGPDPGRPHDAGAHRRYDNRAGRERNRQDLWIGVSYDLLMASSISGKLGLV